MESLRFGLLERDVAVFFLWVGVAFIFEGAERGDDAGAGFELLPLPQRRARRGAALRVSLRMLGGDHSHI